jgi:hypothetical protein
MGRRVLFIVLVLAVALFAYFGYNSYDARRSGVRGDVFSKDSGTAGSKADTPSASSNDGQTVVYPEPVAPVTAPAATSVTSPATATTATPPADQTGPPTTQPSPDGAPATDTISPNPPNGMVFSGTGKYQVYRQGNLTWRINTATGENCILFATDEEWRKPKVYRNGCKSR